MCYNCIVRARFGQRPTVRGSAIAELIGLIGTRDPNAVVLRLYLVREGDRSVLTLRQGRAAATL